MKTDNVVLAFLIILFVLMLVGCSAKPVKKFDDMVKVENTVLNHPELPRPVSSITPLRWKVYNIKGDAVYVGLPFNDSIELRKFLEDSLRYITEINNIVCHYRRDAPSLDDEICKDNQK